MGTQEKFGQPQLLEEVRREVQEGLNALELDSVTRTREDFWADYFWTYSGKLEDLIGKYKNSPEIMFQMVDDLVSHYPIDLEEEHLYCKEHRIAETPDRFQEIDLIYKRWFGIICSGLVASSWFNKEEKVSFLLSRQGISRWWGEDGFVLISRSLVRDLTTNAEAIDLLKQFQGLGTLHYSSIKLPLAEFVIENSPTKEEVMVVLRDSLEDGRYLASWKVEMASLELLLKNREELSQADKETMIRFFRLYSENVKGSDLSSVGFGDEFVKLCEDRLSLLRKITEEIKEGGELLK
ncbi:MAG: hypothetical protein WC531_03895 [Candidatus Paceibacterota bacterium]|jgi:hypothetical protein